MQAVYAASINPDQPLAGLVVGERPEPVLEAGWTMVRVKAAALNHHDLWSLRGVGLAAEQLPMTLGTDAAGVDVETGEAVIVHSVISSTDWRGDETLDPRRTLFSEKHQGTMAELVAVPRRNLVPKPEGLSYAEAACLPTAWLTAYRMLFVNGQARPGQTVLVQGATGGVASAAIALARAAGCRVWVTARTDAKRAVALDLGAHAAFATGTRLPEPVDLVVETVGEATWAHSVRSLRPGGTVVISGATTGANPPAILNRVFFLQLRIIGSTMGTRAELGELLTFLASTGLRPRIDREVPLADARGAFAAMEAGELVGKAVLTVA
ncbi:zinc-binding dehydrogenase [Dactylosporangium sp. NPDC051484]|uniref:zinc-binding dehydrogenase n=1 Tax=Dactylosporangium sp. NPDC051484 TaxID=3154942 RepID=UPI00344DA186